MLSALVLENFKCISKMRLPLAALTLLTGYNAAGKSTSIQSLLLLSQHLRNSAGSKEFALTGDLVRLGSPSEIISQKTKSSLIKLGAEAEGQTLTVSLDARGRNSEVMTVGAHSVVNGGSIDSKVSVEEALRSLVFISAYRAVQSELLPVPDSSSRRFANVGVNGEFCAWWLDKCGDEEIDARRHHANELFPILRKQLAAWGGELFGEAQANAVRLQRTDFLRLELRNSDISDWRRPSNIGYGLSYSLPILLAGLIARPEQIVVVDSPEAHLHPRAQSKMGFFLAKMAAAGVQILIETHSDHLLNGVRLATKAKAIKSDDIAMHFFERKDDETKVTSPLIDDDGQLSEWPSGFFDQSERDLAHLAGWV